MLKVRHDFHSLLNQSFGTPVLTVLPPMKIWKL